MEGFYEFYNQNQSKAVRSYTESTPLHFKTNQHKSCNLRQLCIVWHSHGECYCSSEFSKAFEAESYICGTRMSATRCAPLWRAPCRAERWGRGPAAPAVQVPETFSVPAEGTLPN